MRQTTNKVIPIDMHQRINQEFNQEKPVHTGIPRTERITRMPDTRQLLDNYKWLRREANRQRANERSGN